MQLTGQPVRSRNRIIYANSSGLSRVRQVPTREYLQVASVSVDYVVPIPNEYAETPI